ncbi:MAG: DNA-binding protein WhiA [Clostridia bacterium]|nr:DNA-binding protein WhiA [Clostridia bacterium]
MSFTLRIINELVSKEYEKSCCKKAFIFGLFFSAERISGREIRVELKTEDSALLAEGILKKQFSAEPLVEPVVRAGRRLFWVTLSSKALSIYLDRIDGEGEMTAEEFENIIGFRCEECRRAFLAGVFVSCGISTDPEKRYSLEFGVKMESRASCLSAFLCDTVGEPSCVDRRGRIGLYYKGNEHISDILSYMGASQASYAVIDAYVAHAIRNDENRATNCVLRNIQRSVAATGRHIEAIELLYASGRFELLSEELKYTARLRQENDSATLSELAEMHEPPISKSGLNRRLEKIVEFANQ